jgi:hypothetical protein
MADNSGQIATNALSPRRAGSDGVTAEQHSVPDQIAADQYAAAVAAVQQPLGGLRIARMVQPGTVYPHGFPRGYREV